MNEKSECDKCGGPLVWVGDMITGHMVCKYGCHTRDSCPESEGLVDDDYDLSNDDDCQRVAGGITNHNASIREEGDELPREYYGLSSVRRSGRTTRQIQSLIDGLRAQHLATRDEVRGLYIAHSQDMAKYVLNILRDMGFTVYGGVVARALGIEICVTCRLYSYQGYRVHGASVDHAWFDTGKPSPWEHIKWSE